MGELLKLPVGIDDFEKIRKEKFYYVDKTKLIEQILEQWGKVNLFTRPRRFGKTLNMSMLQHFFEIGTDKALFDGLYISGKSKLCEEYMGLVRILVMVPAFHTSLGALCLYFSWLFRILAIFTEPYSLCKACS